MTRGLRSLLATLTMTAHLSAEAPPAPIETIIDPSTDVMPNPAEVDSDATDREGTAVPGPDPAPADTGGGESSAPVAMTPPAGTQVTPVSTAAVPTAPPSSAGAQKASEPHWRESGAWGWFLIGTSVLLGSVLTATGLAANCDKEESERANADCRRDASLLIWGGVGLSSAGSMIGFVVLQSHDTATQQPSAELRWRAVF